MCMAPLADMANHNRATQWHFHMDINGGAFQIRHKGGVGTIPSNAEVFVSYSSTMSNAQLLYAFGFVIPGNPNDRLDIPRQLLQQGQARIAPEAVVAAKRVRCRCFCVTLLFCCFSQLWFAACAYAHHHE